MKRIILTGMLFTFLYVCLQAENDIQPAQTSQLVRGKKVYIKYCLSCHQQDGSGVPYMYPPLIRSSYANGQKLKLIKIVLYGLKDGVEIEGETYSRPMPQLGTVLSDQQVADVLTYLRNSFGNKSTPVYSAFVKKARSQSK